MDDYRDAIDDTSAPLGEVTIGGSASGTLEELADADFFSVQLTGGRYYTFELLNAGLSDPYLRLYDSAGMQRGWDDDSGEGLNSLLVFQAPADGTYYLSARAWIDGGTGGYTLIASSGRPDDHPDSISVADASRFPDFSITANIGSTNNGDADVDVFRVALIAGVSYSITIAGTELFGLQHPQLELRDTAGGLVEDHSGSTRFTFTPSTSDSFWLFAASDPDTDPNGEGNYVLTVEAIDDFSDDAAGTEPAEPVGALGVGSSLTGVINSVGDHDVFSAALTGSIAYTFHLVPEEADKSYMMVLRDVSGNLLAEDFGSGNLHIPVRPEADAPAYLDVSLQYSYLADGNGYTVYLTEGIDDFADSRDDMFGEPGRLSPPTPLAGSLEDDGDTDIVALTLVEGVNYTVTLQGRGEDPLLDGHLTLRDADGNLLLENDDATEAGESRIEYTPTTGGTYFLEVRSSPAADPTGIGGYTVQATALDDYRDLPGDTLEPLGSIELGTPASGVIEFAGDGDLFPITLQAGHAYNVSLRGAGSGDGSLGNGFVRVLDANGALLRADANSGPGKDAALVFLAPQDGSYFLSAGSEADTTGTYSLRIEFRGLSVVGTPDNDSLDGGTGKDTLSGGEGADALGGLREEDVLLGDGGDDTLNGGGGADYLRGDDGKDLLLGGGGADFLNGWGDRDVLRGGSGNDTLEGGNARDRLEGGAGNDVLFGGTGQDAFIFDTRLSTSNVDRVDYFSSGQDLIRLDRSVFTTLARGPLDPGQLTAGSGAEASVDGDDFLIYDTATGNLYYDADATGTASSPMLFAVLKSYGGVAASLTAADIEVIG